MWLTLVTLWGALAPGGVFVLEDMGETQFKRNTRSWRNSTYARSTGTPTLMAAITDVVTDLVGFSGGVSKRTNQKSKIAPPLVHGVLPNLKSVQCFAEACAFIKCSGHESRCP